MLIVFDAYSLEFLHGTGCSLFVLGNQLSFGQCIRVKRADDMMKINGVFRAG